jgi:hypothetical protein
MYAWTPRGSFPFDFPPKSVRKGLNFGVFAVLVFVVFLAEIFRFLLIQRVLLDPNLSMECPWGVPTIPNVLCVSVERIGRSEVGFGGVDPWALFYYPSCPGATDLTGALDRSDRCKPLVGFVSGNCLFRVVLSRGPAGQFLPCLELFC